MLSWLRRLSSRQAGTDAILNEGLGLAMDWGESWLAPINARLRKAHPHLKEHELDALNVACQGAMRLGCETVHAALLSGRFQVPTIEALAEVVRHDYPWVDDENLERLRRQGVYYAAKVGGYAR